MDFHYLDADGDHKRFATYYKIHTRYSFLLNENFRIYLFQEHVIPSIPHKDYLPDITGPDPEHDYEPEEDDQQGGEEEYDEYPEREND